MPNLKFEYTLEDVDYTTIIEKQWKTSDREFDELMQEIRYCLLAVGYSETLINEYIPPM